MGRFADQILQAQSEGKADGRIMILREKEDLRVIEASALGETALKVISERLKDGWYENWDDGDVFHEWETRANKIVEERQLTAAIEFLVMRKDFEYEGYEVRSLEIL